MPTLRNKTTDKGTIVRWKPHPNHARPSTYQVSSRGITILRDLGYQVPSPGDEESVPPQVCRPLRLLGDLYFESGGQGDIELGNHPKQGYYQSSSLSDEQLRQLRSYIESHPSYIGGIRTELGKEISELPSSKDGIDTPQPLLRPQARNVRETSSGAILLPEPFHIGRVDRISSNKNAMLASTSGREVNLGKLPKSIVDEWVVGVEYRGHWSMCLNAQRWSSGYRSDAREFINGLETLTGLGGLKKILDIEPRRYNKNLLNDEIEAFVSFAGHGLGVAYHGEWVILVDSELVTAGQRVNVRIDTAYGNIAIATPTPPQNGERLSTDDQVEIAIDKIGKNLFVGTFNGELVTIPRESDVAPNQLQVAITDVHEDYVSGAVEALSESERPDVGEYIDICEEKIEQYSSIPVELPEVPLVDSIPIRLPVSEVNSDSVSVSASLFEQKGAITRDMSVTSSIQHWTSDGLVLQTGNIPFLVNGGRYIPEARIQVRPTEFEDGYIKADLENYILPTIPQSVTEGLETGDSRLRERRFKDAVLAFAAVAEMIDKTSNSEQWVNAIVCEIVAQTASYIADNDLEEALRVLAIRTENLQQQEIRHESLSDIIGIELEAYKRIIEAAQHVERAGQAKNGIEKTTERQEAKTQLTDAVDLLQEFQSQLDEVSDQTSSYWIIHEQLEKVADNLLNPPSSVHEYLEELESSEC